MVVFVLAVILKLKAEVVGNMVLGSCFRDLVNGYVGGVGSMVRAAIGRGNGGYGVGVGVVAPRPSPNWESCGRICVW